MSSKCWIDKVVAKPQTRQENGPAITGKRARLAELLLATTKKKG